MTEIHIDKMGKSEVEYLSEMIETIMKNIQAPKKQKRKAKDIREADRKREFYRKKFC